MSQSIVLTKDQEKALHDVESNRISFITGPAGTGKSFLIRYLSEKYKKQGKSVHLLSSTGISAYHIEGMTVHSFMRRIQMPESTFMIQLKPDDSVIIVDEISMLGKKIFEQFEMTLRAIHHDHIDYCSQSFGGHKIIFFGDFCQLPPVNDEFCFESKVWDEIQVHTTLTEIKRQQDVEFQQWLLRIRTGKLTPKDRLLISKLPNRPTTLDAIHLFASNEETVAYNEKCMKELREDPKCVSRVYPSAISMKHFSPEEIEQFFQQRHQCYSTLNLCIGAKIMLTKNIDTAKGWCNGTTGWVDQITEDEIVMAKRLSNGMVVKQSIPKCIYRRVKCGAECQVMITRGEKQVVCGISNCSVHPVEDTRCPYLITHGPKKGKICHAIDCKRHPKSSVTYIDMEGEFQDEPTQYMDVEQFPLVLAWGITIHKSQGMTLENVAIHLPKYRYSSSLVYVALSRCKRLDGISVQSDTPIKYECICPEEMVMKQLLKYPERTCAVCQDLYTGPYRCCKDCCSAPGKYSRYCFQDFAKNPTEDMLRYVEFALEHPTYSTAIRWTKFVSYMKRVYRYED